MRRLMLVAVSAFLILAAPASAGSLLNPNQGKPASINSGLSPVKACAGAQSKLPATWRAAGKRFKVSWRILAAITKVESDYGCNMGPSQAGAVGWTQFMPGTWKSWGMDADGDQQADPKNSVDAIFSSARYLRVNGAPDNYRKALYAYNRANWYVKKVLKTAKQFTDFSANEFDRMTIIARDYTLLEDRLNWAGEQLSQIKDKQKGTAGRLKKSQRILKTGQLELIKADQAFSASRDQLDQATLKYVQSAQSVQGLGQSTSDQQLMSYLAGARPQDAVLIYISAKAIMARQNSQISKLRVLAEKAATNQWLAQQISSSQQLAAKTEVASTVQLKVLADDQQTVIKNGRADLKEKARVVRTYAAHYLKITGDRGSLAGSPFADLIEGSVLWGGEWRWPVSGAVTSVFGYRCLGSCRQHEGVDLAASYGSRIQASAAGKVISAGVSGGYGNMVEIRHGDGYTTRYAHMSSIKVRVGQQITPGDTVGLIGCTGNCFGDHLHFEIRLNGVAKNPLTYLPRR